MFSFHKGVLTFSGNFRMPDWLVGRLFGAEALKTASAWGFWRRESRKGVLSGSVEVKSQDAA